MLLTLQTAIQFVRNDIGANNDPATRINLTCEKFLFKCDPPGSLERVTFVVNSDANGEGFIELPERYQAIRGAVENPTETFSACGGRALSIRNGWYEYTPGNLGMLRGSDPLRGIIPIPKSAPDDPVTYKVPACPTEGTQTFFTAICKLAFVLLEDDTDILPITNINALRKGLRALSKEDANDFVRAKQLWEQGIEDLCSEKDNEEGPASQGKVQFDDDWEVGNLSDVYYGGDRYAYGPWR